LDKILLSRAEIREKYVRRKLQGAGGGGGSKKG
jgi:hypothetical protein